jgi:uncharacterized alpha-E superfamily protein
MNTLAQPLLSRVADAVYWMARYIERAENVARFLDVNHNLMLDLPGVFSSQWQPIINTTGDRVLFADRYGEATQQNAVRFLAFDDEYPNSIYSCILAARENARSVRETISSEMWRQINSLYLMITSEARKAVPESLPEFCHQVRMGCHLFEGITHSTVSHNEAWHFISLGRRLERADKTTRVLDVKYFILLPSVSRCTARSTAASRPIASSSSCSSTANFRARCATRSARPTRPSTRSPARPAAVSPAPPSSASACYARSWTSPASKPFWKAACTSSSTTSRRK